MRKDVVRFFDDQATDYNDKYEKIDDLRSFIFSERKRIVLDMLGGNFGRILDIGCGPGVYTGELVNRCERLYGIDISNEMIEIARKKRYGNAEFSVGAIEDLRFDNGYFDATVCAGVLEYLDDVEKGIREVARVTRKGGIAIFTAPNADSVLNRLDYCMRSALKACRRIVKIDTSKSFMDYDFKPVLFSRGDLEPMLNKCGFDLEGARFHIFRVSFLNRLSPGLSLSLARRFNFVSNRFLAINCIIKARKR